MGYFAHRTAAKRYARGRPFFHPLVIDRVRETLGLRAPLPRALDVACGTGQSAVALKPIAARIVGTDLSGGMLAQAPRDARIGYIAASAERLPFGAAPFDLVTVALAFHWFDRARFLAEAHRLLRPAGWLVIYNNGFLARMAENPAFEEWSRDHYLMRYPTPPRNNRPFTHAEAAAHGFRFAARERFENRVAFSVAELVRYLMTQSNVIAAVEEGKERPDEVYAWLVHAIAPLFTAPRGTFSFGNTVWYLQRPPNEGP